jgi:hypothetical protein
MVKMTRLQGGNYSIIVPGLSPRFRPIQPITYIMSWLTVLQNKVNEVIDIVKITTSTDLQREVFEEGRDTFIVRQPIYLSLETLSLVTGHRLL